MYLKGSGTTSISVFLLYSALSLPALHDASLVSLLLVAPLGTVVGPLSVKFCHKTINRFVGEKKTSSQPIIIHNHTLRKKVIKNPTRITSDVVLILGSAPIPSMLSHASSVLWLASM